MTHLKVVQNKFKTFFELPEDRQRYYSRKASLYGGVPARFFHNGQSVDVNTGVKASKGCNVMYQYVVWSLSKPVARELAAELGLTVYFSE